MTSAEATTALKAYIANADGGWAAFLAWVSAQDWTAQPRDWVSAITSILQMSGPKAAAAAPCLLRWLKRQDPNGTYTRAFSRGTAQGGNPNSILFQFGFANGQRDVVVVDSTYFSGVSALAAIGAELPDTRLYLEDAFKLATNWDARFTLAAGLLKVDAKHVPALSLMTNAWVNELDRVRWQQVSNVLAGAQFEVRQLPEPVRLRPAPMSQWLALGKGAAPCTLGPPLKDWWIFLGTQEPEHKGHPLREWFLVPDPERLHSVFAEPTTDMVAAAVATLTATKTNCIAWFLKWIQAPTAEHLVLARRGFGLLGTNSLVALPALVELTQSESAATRTAAYTCLSRIGPEWETLWPALIPALHHTNAAVRVEAARYLADLFPEHANESGLNECLPLALRRIDFPFRPKLRW
jgi:hypothetical protein